MILWGGLVANRETFLNDVGLSFIMGGLEADYMTFLNDARRSFARTLHDLIETHH